MKVTVDCDKCMGHGQCFNICAELYTLDERGYNNVQPGTEVPRELEARARKGAQACPERAIAVIEDGAR